MNALATRAAAAAAMTPPLMGSAPTASTSLQQVQWSGQYNTCDAVRTDQLGRIID
jgi:hypothetical protein